MSNRRTKGATTIVLAVAAICESHTALAVQPEVGAEVFFDSGVGSDPIVTLEYTDGTAETMNGGTGVGLRAVGGVKFFRPGSHQLEALGNLGFKVWRMRKAENADLKFWRFPLELLVFYRNDSAYLRAGGGLTYHTSVATDGSGAASDLSLDFKPALGYVLQADLIFGVWNFGPRYVWINYRPQGIPVDIAANYVGVQLGCSYDFSKHRRRSHR